MAGGVDTTPSIADVGIGTRCTRAILIQSVGSVAWGEGEREEGGKFVGKRSLAEASVRRERVEEDLVGRGGEERVWMKGWRERKRERVYVFRRGARVNWKEREREGRDRGKRSFG